MNIPSMNLVCGGANALSLSLSSGGRYAAPLFIAMIEPNSAFDVFGWCTSWCTIEGTNVR